MQRVQKILSNAGICSRRKAEELIEAGKVKVNGKVIGLGDQADQAVDSIEVKGERITFDKKRYIMLNKPKHILTTLSDPSGKKTVLDLIEDIPERIYPVGRLDFDAEGLLLMTNDGDFANTIMHPRYELIKTYQAELRDRIPKERLESLIGRIRLKDGFVKIERTKLIGNRKIEIAIHEGRNKIVKRIFKSMGLYVANLKRVQIGDLRLGNLKTGRWRDLKEEEIRLLSRKKVMVFGSYDVLHKGHMDFFRQAKKHGNELIVVVGRDSTIEQVKGRPPHHNEKDRLKHVSGKDIVDKAVLGDKEDRYRVIRENRPDVICLGHDQNSFTEGLRDFLRKNRIPAKVIRMQPYKRHIYSSSRIKKRLGLRR